MAYPANSWPSITGVASMRWVRPDFTTSANSLALASRDAARVSRPGMRTVVAASSAATWIEEGKTSLLDWEALTWSLGCTWRPRARLARVAMTSLVFMFEEVPEPVWNTSIGKWSSNSPEITRSAAPMMAAATSSSSTPSSLLARAAAFLICARAAMWWAAMV